MMEALKLFGVLVFGLALCAVLLMLGGFFTLCWLGFGDQPDDTLAESSGREDHG